MTDLTRSPFFEGLKRQLREEFDLAVQAGERKPESVAFIVNGQIFGGHARNQIKQNAVAHAFSKVAATFPRLDLTPDMLPFTIMVMTEKRRDLDEPAKPSSRITTTLEEFYKGAALKSVHLLVLDNQGSPEKQFEYPLQKEPAPRW